MAQPPAPRALRPAILGMLAAVLAVASQIFLPIPYVPITLQTVVTGLIGLILPPLEALACIGVYLALGAIGIPVFSGFKAGLGALLGPTGGFLLGFLVQVWTTSWLFRLRPALSWAILLRALSVGIVALLGCGGAWLRLGHGMPWAKLVTTFQPLLPGAVLKVWLSATVFRALAPNLPPPYRFSGTEEERKATP